MTEIDEFTIDDAYTHWLDYTSYNEMDLEICDLREMAEDWQDTAKSFGFEITKDHALDWLINHLQFRALASWKTNGCGGCYKAPYP